MEPDVVYTRTVVVIAYIAITLYGILLARKFATCRLTLSGNLSSARRALRRCCSCEFLTRSEGPSRIEVEARKLATKQRLAYWKLLIKLCMHFTAVSLLFFLYFRHLDGRVWASEAVSQDASSDPFLLCLLLLGAGMLIEIREKMLTVRFTDYYQFAWMGLLIWKIAGNEDVFLLIFRSRGIAPMRFILAVWTNNTFLTFILNVAYALVSVWSYLRLAQGQQHDIDEKFQSGSGTWFIFDEVVMVFVACIATYAIETRGLNESRATVKAHRAKQSEATVFSLLTCVCDAVVRLSGDFEIISGAAGLLSLLLKQPGSVHKFLEAISRTDHQRFREYASSTHSINVMETANSGPAPSLHVSMLDANGTLVDVQLFMASFPDLDNGYEYLLGIREISNEEVDMGPAFRDFSMTTSIAEHATYPVVPSRRPTISVKSTSSDSKDSTGSHRWQTHVPKSLGSSGDCSEFSAVVNLFTYTIVEGSLAFVGLGGPSTIGGNFAKWLLDEDAFKGRVQTSANEYIDDGQIQNNDLAEVRLQPVVAEQAQLEYRADCFWEFLWNQADDLEDDDMFIRVVLTNLSQRRSRRRKSWRRTAARLVSRSGSAISL